MTDILLYQSVLQKLGQLNPNDLSQLDAFLSILVKKTKKKMQPVETTSAIDCLEQLAQIGGVSSIENPIEWQRETRQDRKLSFR